MNYRIFIIKLQADMFKNEKVVKNIKKFEKIKNLLILLLILIVNYHS